MISVLVPYYNWDVSSLINDLITSAESLDSEVELVVCDDCSADNQIYTSLRNQFGHIPIFRLLRNSRNMGRSVTRNRLVKAARYDRLVFIDGDSRLSSPQTYLSNYTGQFDPQIVLVGGTHYAELPPSSSKKLHWKYGSNRESKPADVRNREPLRFFFSNNFCCARSLFESVKFDEQIKNYGYEDSIWARKVLKKGMEIQHIDNYVIHKGLKNNSKFLRDSDEAVTTLAQMFQHDTPSAIRLLEYYRRLKCRWYGRILLSLLLPFRTTCRRILESGMTTNLAFYDTYRLITLHDLRNKQLTT